MAVFFFRFKFALAVLTVQGFADFNFAQTSNITVTKLSRKTRHYDSWLPSVRSSSPDERPRYQRVVLLPGERLGSNSSSTAAAPTVPEGKTGVSEGAASPQVAKVPGFVMAKIKTPKEGKEDGEVTTDDEEEQTEADSQGRDTAAPVAEMTPPTVQKKGRRSSPSPIKRVPPHHSTSMRRGEEEVEEEKLQKRLRNLERQKLDMAKHRKEEEEEERKKTVAVRKEGESRVATVAPMPAVAADSETDLEKEIEDLEQKEESNSWLREQIEELRRELNDLKVGLKL